MAGPPQGGAENFFCRLTKSFYLKGIEQSLILRPFEQFFERLPHIKIKAASFYGRFDLITKQKIRNEIRIFNPDIILTWMNRASIITPKQKNIPIVSRLGGYYNLKYYKNSDYLIGNTKGIVNYFHKHGFDRNKTFYLPNFPDLPSGPDLSFGKIQQNNNGKKIILSLGRFHKDKAFDVLINAMKLLPDNVYLWLIGSGPEKENLYNLSRDIRERVIFIPWSDNVSGFYKSCDIFVCSSRVEPLGNVILEAFAHKKPVIASSSDGPLELIKNGYNGCLVPLEDALSLSNTINQLLENKEKRDAIAENGYKTYIENFTEELVVKEYVNVFKKIISEKSQF